MKASGELKTKPTQHSVKELRSLGIQPDIIICRSEKKIPIAGKKKISLFCNVNIKTLLKLLMSELSMKLQLVFIKKNLMIASLVIF